MTSDRKRLVLTARARMDYLEILQFTTVRWGREQADRYEQDLLEAFSRVVDNPLIGRDLNRLRTGLRSITIRSQICYYLSDGETITIVRVLHSRREPRRHLKS